MAVSLDSRQRSLLRRWLPTGIVAAAVFLSVFLWSAPRAEVALPGPDATPMQVVRAYIDAVNARDFHTSNAINSRPGLDHDRLADLCGPTTSSSTGPAWTALRHTCCSAPDFSGGDGTVADGTWGYVLKRGSDGLWHITDAGVA